jgi:phage-related protein
MSSIVKAVSDLAASLVELVWSFFTTAGHLVQNTASFAAKFASEIIELILNFFKGLVDLAGGIVSFLVGELQTDCLTLFSHADNLLGNVIMLAVLAAAFFGFLQYQRSQGRPVKVGNKKLN